MSLKLLHYPNTFLDKKLDDVDLENPGFDPKELKEQMVDLMLESKGIGLSASQVGLNYQLFVMGDSKENSTICINPKVLQHTEDTVQEPEGCLSFPGVYVPVTRPKEILVEYYDENLEKVHEWDHLQGVTFKDRVSKLKWAMAQKKAKKYDRLT
jgi:peptide deformylase